VKMSTATPSLGSLAVPPSLSTSTFSASDSTSTEPASAGEKHISSFAKIASVRVDGNKNVRERVVLAEVKSRKGDLYDPARLRKDVQAIYALGNFDDVTLDVTEVPAGVAVIFHVIEKPMIKKIDFKGNKKLSSGKLRDGISLKENDPLDKLKLNLDVDKILNLYKDEGFAAAQV
jgi:outer membrane protein insertion porin family